MENLGKRTTLAIAAIFLVATLGWYLLIKTIASHNTAHECTYQTAIICTQT